jgi:dipeptidyl aminopeptidase/acylaminoacyl peptidase
MWPAVVIAAIFIFGAVSIVAAEDKDEDKPDKTKVRVGKWLMLGPFESPFPVFNEEDKDRKMDAGDLLGCSHLAIRDLDPGKGRTIGLKGGERLVWSEMTARDSTGVLIPAGEGPPRVAYLAAWVEVPRWMKVDLKVRATHPFELFFDGESKIKRKGGGKMAKEKSGDATLEKGKHLVVVKSVYAPEDSLTEWRFDLTVSGGKDFEPDPVAALDPQRTMTIHDVLDGPSISGVLVSPDGSLFKMSMSKRTPPDGDRDSWVEIRRVKDGELVRTIQDLSGAGRWQWAPTGNRLSYVVTDDKKSSLRVIDLDNGEIRTVLKDIKDFGGYRWGPDGTFVIYTIDKDPPKDKTGVKRLLGVYDKRHYERSYSSLFLASVPSGLTRKITSGEYSTYLFDIHPDGRKVLFGRSWEDVSERPYSREQMILLDLDDMSTEVLIEGRFLGGARWSPDGKNILMTGGPSAFGDVGINVPDGVIPNDYDRQVYIFDPATKEAEAITRDFDPAVNSVSWPEGNNIYLMVEETEFERIYKYDVKKKTFKVVDVDCDVFHSSSTAKDAPVAVLVGSGANRPWRLYSIDMKGGKAKTLLEPVKDRFESVTIGPVEDWNFTMADGTEIVGRIHFPPDFDESRKWPCIVYYYGGTSPVTRSFGGRYPKNLWAANGYVVWVLQPSGATGFGQEFSARHVNDWGITTAPEIIEGTKKFLEAHPYVDPGRVGCIGASFGGFMTQLVITKTDIFAAAVSHAGISSISSYWGEGYWGYGYNAVSAAESFPWNRPDIYIDQSPLFAADQVTTPLLLLHGAADTNVPRGESDQMYAALKLLGKEVEYIRYDGQNHFIIEYKKRIAWSNAILAWFDKWCKGEPEWWDEMYPPVGEKDGKDGDQ